MFGPAKHVELLTKITEYAVFQLSLCHWFVPIETEWTVFWWSNGKVRFPTKIIYAAHSKLLQTND